MVCEKCKQNPATVFMTKIVNGIKTEVRLCPECSFMAEMPISFENLFQGFLNSIQSVSKTDDGHRPKPAPTTACLFCGMTYEGFKQAGKLGCAQCYQTFSNEMEALFKNVQGSIRHEGKYPMRSGSVMRQKREAEQLRSHLKKAIEEENYEQAAQLRDKIKELEHGAL